jgi:hypothetical protein
VQSRPRDCTAPSAAARAPPSRRSRTPARPRGTILLRRPDITLDERGLAWLVIVAEPEWQGVLTAEDKRGLTALFWAHVRRYGDIKLNMTKRLALSARHTPDPDRESA